VKPHRFLSFSLLTIFLVTVIAALSVSQVVMMRQVGQARKDVAAAQVEIAAVRKEFGYIKVTAPQLLHISRIEAAENAGPCVRAVRREVFGQAIRRGRRPAPNESVSRAEGGR